MKNLPYTLTVLMASASFAPSRPGEKPRSDRELIQGTWEVVSSTEAGKNVPADKTRAVQFIFTADTLTIKPAGARGPKDTLGMKYRLDPTSKPRAIDTSHEIDPGKPIVQLGIYSLEGDTLKLCLEAAGKPRPTRFESRVGESSVGFVLRRVKKAR
jgi:uncharacterized protein (TIGR03067 family)